MEAAILMLFARNQWGGQEIRQFSAAFLVSLASFPGREESDFRRKLQFAFFLLTPYRVQSSEFRYRFVILRSEATKDLKMRSLESTAPHLEILRFAQDDELMNASPDTLNPSR